MSSDQGKLRFRQVHMDFHTSPHIPDVGVNFDAEAFAKTLKNAHVNSVTVFSKCHHGLSYHPTEVGLMHPSLKQDLLGEMIEACHRYDIKAPVYFSVTRDDYAGEIHPEWRQVDREGRLGGRSPLQSEKGWANLCLNSPYTDFLAAQVTEVMERYSVDGVFFDIVYQLPPGCACHHCLKSMKELGLTPERDADLVEISLIVERRFMKRFFELVKSYNPDATVWFNSRTRVLPDPELGVRPEMPYQTHVEIESLPSGGWNYNHWPLFSRYFQGFGKETLGMTGRFHKSWGDFGGMKNLAALEYECFSCLARGAKISIGDQLHPRGVLDDATYERIGNVFARVEEMEPWIENSTPVTEIAILLGGGQSHDLKNNPHLISTEGAMRMLLETHHQFDVIDKEADFNRYKLIIAPDSVRFDDELASSIRSFIKSGGRLLLSDESGLNKDEDEFSLSEIGLSYEGKSPYSVEYFEVSERWDPSLSSYQYVIYERGSRVKGMDTSKIAAAVYQPYFERTWERYVSHAQTPVDQKTDYPAVYDNGSVIYLAHPIFKAYKKHGNRIYKQIVEKCVVQLLDCKPLVRSNLPSTAQVTLTAQTNRTVAHVLHYVPQRRADIDIIEDVLPLVDIRLEVRSDSEPSKVYLAPQMQEIPFQYGSGIISMQINRIDGYQLIVLEN